MILEAENISLKLKGKLILDQVSVQLEKNKITTLIGPNGAGKTSLVRILLGLLKPQSGTIHRKPGLRTGYMPQKVHISETLPLDVKRFLCLSYPRPQHSHLQAVLERLNIADLHNVPIQSLSGGEMQRVLLARAIMRSPHLLILDEPVQGVDIMGQVKLYQLIRELRDEYACAVLMVSHDLHLVMSATDEVLCLNQHLCCAGHPENVTRHPAYLEIFGQFSGLSVYQHHHDHTHDIHGAVTEQQNHG